MTLKLKLSALSLAALFALMLTLAFIVPGMGFMALLSFTPLFCMEKLCSDNGAKHTWWYGYAAFLFYNTGASYWIWYVSNVGAVTTIILNSLQMAAIFALFRWSKKTFSRIGRKWAEVVPYAIFTVLWMAWEHIYFTVELSWPWLVLGNAFATSTKLVQWYEVLGSLGGSLWILSCSTTAFFLLTSKKRRKVASALLAVFVTVPTTLSLVRYYTYKETSDPIEIVVVQPNVDPFAKYGIQPQEKLDNEFLALADSCMTDSTIFILTPETFTYDIDLDSPGTNPSFNRYMDYLSIHPNTRMILGALTYRTYGTASKPSQSARRSGSTWYDTYNTAMVIDTCGMVEYYHKSKLVPGVEIIPYQRFLPFLGRIVSACGGSSGSYGVMEDMKAIGDDIKLAPMICYESIYGDYSRRATKYGARFMAVMTNDGWWGDTPGYRQHFRFASLRAIENRRDVVHAANTGISGFIDQKGDVTQRTGWWVKTAIRGNVNLNSSLTPFARHGDLTGTICSWAALVSLLLTCILSLRKNKAVRG